MQTALRQHVSAGRESDDVMGCIHVFVGRYGLAMHAETTFIYIYNTQVGWHIQTHLEYATVYLSCSF